MSSNIEDAIVDFKDYGLAVKYASQVNAETLKALGKKVVDVFKRFGFCYLKNHGVDEKLLEDYRRVSRDFFEKPTEFKKKYPLSPESKFGWVGFAGEHLDKDRPGELKEVFNYAPESEYESWPDVENFESLFRKLYEEGTQLSFRFCDVLSLGLDQPINFMRDAHKFLGHKENRTILRTLYYPPIPDDWKIQPGQRRLGEHTDYGSVTFVFQDDVGGLEMQSPRTGEFVSATPVAGTALVNIAGLLQRWTSDSLIATVHRILIPEEELRKKAIRQSVVFFLQPDDEFIVKCLDGSEKYEPISSYDYMETRFTNQYLPYK